MAVVVAAVVAAVEDEAGAEKVPALSINSLLR